MMTCPIRLSTICTEEIATLPVHWLTADAPWNPAEVTVALEEKLLDLSGYAATLGEIDLLSFNFTMRDLGEM